MPRAKKSKSDTSAQIGKVKLPTSFVVAVITAIMAGVGGTAAGQIQKNDLIKEREDLAISIAKLQTDVEWIKKRLSQEDGYGELRPELTNTCSQSQ